jgi:hypothetical protein
MATPGYVRFRFEISKTRDLDVLICLGLSISVIFHMFRRNKGNCTIIGKGGFIYENVKKL